MQALQGKRLTGPSCGTRQACVRPGRHVHNLSHNATDSWAAQTLATLPWQCGGRVGHDVQRQPCARSSPAVVRSALAEAPSTSAEGCNRGAHWQVHKFGGTCMASADRMQGAADLIIKSPGDQKVVVVSAMGSAPNSPIKVTDMILNMISKAAKQDAAFLVDLASLQEKHIETAKLLLGGTSELTAFVSRLMDDIANLKAMLQAISIGEAGGGFCCCRYRAGHCSGRLVGGLHQQCRPHPTEQCTAPYSS